MILNSALKCVALAAGLAVASPAVSQDLEYWGSVRGWDVLIDPSLGWGCFIQADYNDGSTVRIGFNMNEENGYVAFFNYAWDDIRQGDWYDVEFFLDRKGYTAEAQGIYVDGVPGAYISFDNEDFLFDIAKKYTMTVFADGNEVINIDLDGTYAGLSEAINCQENM